MANPVVIGTLLGIAVLMVVAVVAIFLIAFVERKSAVPLDDVDAEQSRLMRAAMDDGADAVCVVVDYPDRVGSMVRATRPGVDIQVKVDVGRAKHRDVVAVGHAVDDEMTL